MLEQEGLRVISGHQFLRSRRFVPERGGVYTISLRNGDLALDAMGYFEMGGVAPWTLQDTFTHVYTGSSGNLRGRLAKHLVGDARVSSFRKTLLAGEYLYGALAATGAKLPQVFGSEAGLDFWLGMNALIAFKRCPNYLAEETRILRFAPSPLNITLRRSNIFAQHLMSLRQLYDARPRSQPIESGVSDRDFNNDIKTDDDVPAESRVNIHDILKSPLVSVAEGRTSWYSSADFDKAP